MDRFKKRIKRTFSSIDSSQIRTLQDKTIEKQKQENELINVITQYLEEYGVYKVNCKVLMEHIA